MTQTPAPTTEATISESESESERMAGLVKPLVWTDPAPPNDIDCRYDHVRADTPFGQISIEWKSWKEYDPYDVFFQDGHIESQARLDAAKAAAQSEYVKRILSALDLSLITQQAAEIVGLKAERDALLVSWPEYQAVTGAAVDRAEASESREAALLEKVRVMGEALEAAHAYVVDARVEQEGRLIEVGAYPSRVRREEARLEAICKDLALIRAARAHNP